jgi:peptidyl-Asp metalloendopeptidase
VIRSLLVSILVTLGAQTAAAQVAEPLFVHRTAIAADAVQAPISGRAAVLSRVQVGVQIDRLFASPGVALRVLLNTGDQTWTARFERLDTDAAGFRSWVGGIDGISDSHVVFTERNGVVSGLINAGGVTYQVRTDGSESYLLERIDVSRLGDERDPVTAPDPPQSSLEAESLAADNSGTIDVLMLYTPSARAQRGGTESIESLVSQIISDTNTALARSAVITRVRLVAAREFSIIESATMGTDLTTLETKAAPLRDQLHADLVQLLVHSPDLSTCGIGYLLKSLTSTNFPAYSVADIACAAQYTPTHEMAHNMGSNHAPEDGATGALFAYSNGFKDPVHGFRTIMAFECFAGSCPRILNFSNPRVTYSGQPTGTADRRDNARSLSEAAFTVANFRRADPPSTLTPPGAPTGLRSVVAGNSVTAAWDAVSSDGPAFPSSAATEYFVQVGTSTGAANVYFASTGSATAAAGMLADGIYFWRVMAVNLAGASPPSEEAQFTVGVPCLAPSAPRHFIFGISGNHVTLAWTPPASGSAPVSFIVEVGSESGSANQVVAPVGPVTSIGTAAPPGIYFVRVRAENACGTSTPSNEQVITVP